MLFLAWTIVGTIFGVIWSRLIKSEGENLFSPLLLAISGAIIGGLLFTLFGTTSWTKIDIYNLVVSTAGALVFLSAYYSIKQIY
jgi:uncharacterized membrane protein YeaQ/YmgE (transglycosylase-associated protein family)